MKIKNLLLVVLGVAGCMTASASSFDCSKAQSNVEHLICDAPELSRLDEELNKAYLFLRSGGKDKQLVITEQRRWLNETRNVCSDADCLKNAYTTRIGELSGSGTSPRQIRKTVKHALVKPREMDDFESFIKEREYLDDPYEIASSEADKLLRFIEKRLRTEKSSSAEIEENQTWRKEFVAYLKEGNGDYLKIADSSYIVQSYFQNASLSGIFFVDMKSGQFKRLSYDYALEVVDKGYLPDGTGWLLAGYGGLSHGISFEGYYLITFYDGGEAVYATSTRAVHEDYGYSEESPAVGSYEYWCGPEDNRVSDIAGRVQGHEWKDLNGDRQDELTFKVEEKDCRQAKKPSIKRRLVYAISKGKITELY